MSTHSQYKHFDLTETIIGVFYSVCNELGFGFLESVYRKSMEFALKEKGLSVQAEVPVPVFFRGMNVGDFRATSVELGLILNFGPKPQVRRLLYDNERKRLKARPAGESL